MDKRAEFLDAITLGMDIESACHLVGAAPASVYRLLERGKKEQARLSTATRAIKPKDSEAGALELWKSVAEARSAGQRRLLKNIQAAGAEDWKASKFLLEKMNPHVFGPAGSVREIEDAPLGEIGSL